MSWYYQPNPSRPLPHRAIHPVPNTPYLLRRAALPALVVRLLGSLESKVVRSLKADKTSLTVGLGVNFAVEATDKRLGVVGVDVKALDVGGKIVAFARFADASEGLAGLDLELDEINARVAVISAGFEGGVFFNGHGAGAEAKSGDCDEGEEMHFEMCWDSEMMEMVLVLDVRMLTGFRHRADTLRGAEDASKGCFHNLYFLIFALDRLQNIAADRLLEAVIRQHLSN